MKILYDFTIWGQHSKDTPPPIEQLEIVQSSHMNGYTGIVCLDIEHFPVYSQDPKYVGYMLEILRFFKSNNPSCQFGFYGNAPLRDSTSSLMPRNHAVYKDWQRKNDLVSAIAQNVDVLMPSIYTLYPDVDRWEIMAKEIIRECRRYSPSKTVLPFLWPQYHDTGTIPSELRSVYLDEEYFYVQLKTAHNYADGMILWKDFSTESWDEGKPWVRALRRIQGNII